MTVLHDDVSRLRQRGDKVDQEKTDNDTRTTTVTRPDGTEIVTVRDASGNIVQRYRKLPDGTVQVIIGQVEKPGFFGRILGQGPRPVPPQRPHRPNLNFNFGPLQVQIPRDQYIVDMSRANEQQLQAALAAPPVEQVERPYSLEEIRRSGRLRDKVRRIDFDTITFDTNQATISDSQVPTMQAIGEAIRTIIDKDPTQVFLIEGHTDAVGSDLYNLALSDRRAETVAEVLSYYFDVPAENLITQGYGEQFLKVPTAGRRAREPPRGVPQHHAAAARRRTSSDETQNASKGGASAPPFFFSRTSASGPAARTEGRPRSTSAFMPRGIFSAELAPRLRSKTSP